MKKFLIAVLVTVVAGGAIAWSKRTDILLALVKYQASQRYADVAPNREIPWQQGPAELLVAEFKENWPEAWPDLDSALADALGTLSLREAVDRVTAATGLPRRQVYQRALALAKEGE